MLSTKQTLDRLEIISDISAQNLNRIRHICNNEDVSRFEKWEERFANVSQNFNGSYQYNTEKVTIAGNEIDFTTIDYNCTSINDNYSRCISSNIKNVEIDCKFINSIFKSIEILKDITFTIMDIARFPPALLRDSSVACHLGKTFFEKGVYNAKSIFGENSYHSKVSVDSYTAHIFQYERICISDSDLCSNFDYKDSELTCENYILLAELIEDLRQEIGIVNYYTE
jgi:hypothetical protein